MKDSATVLFSYHPTAAETTTITRPIDNIFNLRRHITATQEVGMQGMRHTILNRKPCRHKRLPQNLAAKNLGRSDITALTTKTVAIQLFQMQQLKQISEHSIHMASSAAATVTRIDIL